MMLASDSHRRSITSTLISFLGDKSAPDKIVIAGRTYDTDIVNGSITLIPQEYRDEYTLGVKILDALKFHEKGSYRLTITKYTKAHSEVNENTRVSFHVERHVMGTLGIYVNYCGFTQRDILRKKLSPEFIYHDSNPYSTLEKMIAPINAELKSENK